MDCQFSKTVDNKQKHIKNNSKNFQRQSLADHKMQSENSSLFRRNIKFERCYIPPFS